MSKIRNYRQDWRDAGVDFGSLSFIEKKKFMCRLDLRQRGWNFTTKQIAEARDWVQAHDELEARYRGPRPSLAEQNAMLKEMGLVSGVYDEDEPVAPYPSEGCEDVGQPAGLSAARVIADYDRAYEFGHGGVYLNSPGAYWHAKRATERAAAA